MPKEPYAAGIAAKSFAAKRDIEGKMVVIAYSLLTNRELNLIVPGTRAVQKNEIQEILVTDEPEAGPGKVVNRIAGQGFFEVTQGGVIRSGDKVTIGGKQVGNVAGFDETHFPNHMNIVLKSSELIPGADRGLRLEDPVVFSAPE